MVYFINSESNHVKIGWTEDCIYKRLQVLQSSNPEHLEILYLIEGSQKQEKELHIHFKDKKIRGEWFNITKKEIEEILCAFNILGIPPKKVKRQNYTRGFKSFCKEQGYINV